VQGILISTRLPNLTARSRSPRLANKVAYESFLPAQFKRCSHNFESEVPMDSYTSNGIALVICHCIGAFVMLVLTSSFIKMQWRKVLSNKFVAITLLMSVSIILAEIVVIPRLVYFEFVLHREAPLSKRGADALLYFNGLLMLIASGAHVWLLYLRTRVIVENMRATTLYKFYNSMVLSTAVIGFMVELVRARLFYQGDPNHFTKALEISFAILSAFFAICVSSVDVISTYWFVKYVKASTAALGSQAYVKNEFRNIIAKMGTNICICSFLVVIIFAASRIPTERVPQDWMIMVVMVGFFAISIMWMSMKKNLDKQNGLDSAMMTSSNRALSTSIHPTQTE
jgi:hypothetical protein